MDTYNTEHFYDSLQVLECREAVFDRKERLSAMEKPLLAWYRKKARSLPWRDDPKPYRVWVSEIMLQQTRVEAVKPYFERFMKAFPDIEQLACAKEDHLMKMWEGLGYYNRARNLQAAAKKVMEAYGGQLPSSFEELLKLPGIGTYTAGAIASIAYHIPVPAVDGNVLRVISRFLGDREDIRKASFKADIETELKAVMPQDCASSYNQGLIEVGALVCIPAGEPKCGECPLHSLCRTRMQGCWREIPYKSPPKARKIEDKTVFIIEYQDKVAIRKRPSAGLLASLYELPNLEGHLKSDQVAIALRSMGVEAKKIEPLVQAKHIFSHVEWHMIGYRITADKTEATLKEGSENGECFFVYRKDLKNDYALPGAFKAYTKLIG